MGSSLIIVMMARRSKKSRVPLSSSSSSSEDDSSSDESVPSVVDKRKKASQRAKKDNKGPSNKNTVVKKKKNNDNSNERNKRQRRSSPRKRKASSPSPDNNNNSDDNDDSASSGGRRIIRPPPSVGLQGGVAMMCMPASSTEDELQKQRSDTGGARTTNDNMAMLLDLSRRQMGMQQQGGDDSRFGFGQPTDFGQRDRTYGAAAATGGSALANYAGTTADSFAQSFVDRWAGKMGGLGLGGGGGGDTMSSFSQSPAMRGGNVMMSSWQQNQMQGGNSGGGMSGGLSGSDLRMMRMMMEMEQQGGGGGASWMSSGAPGWRNQQQGGDWKICTYCQNRAFKSLYELQAHENSCSGSFGGTGQRGGAGGGGGVESLAAMMGQPRMTMDLMQQQMDNSFMGCLPIGTSLPSSKAAAAGMGGNESQIGGSGSKEIAPKLPPMEETVTSGKKPAKASKKKPPVPKEDDAQLVENSKGPFKTLDKPILLALDGDEDWLTPLHCYVRRQCVEVFTATADDTSKTTTKGKRRPVTVGQIGLRCPHCNKDDGDGQFDKNNRGSIYYPNGVGHVYNATMNLLQRHLFYCPSVPPEILKKYLDLKKDDARSGTSKKYWMESAKSLGFVDTLDGIKLSAKPAPPPPVLFSEQKETSGARKRAKETTSLRNEDEINDDGKSEEKNKDNTQLKSQELENDASPLVLPDDKSTATKYSFLLISQMRRCVFTEADRLGKRKGLTSGFAGLACRHCFDSYGSGRFFPSSIKTLSDTSKTLNVIQNHMERCRKVPRSVVDELNNLKRSHESERALMKFGSQKG